MLDGIRFTCDECKKKVIHQLEVGGSYTGNFPPDWYHIEITRGGGGNLGVMSLKKDCCSQKCLEVALLKYLNVKIVTNQSK